MLDIGYLSLALAMILSLYSTLTPMLGRRAARGDMLKSAINGVYGVAILVTIASAALIHAFVTRNFQVEYVSSYSSSDLPLFYTISAFWAGQKGSLLLWVWLLSIFSVIVMIRGRKDNAHLLPFAAPVLMITVFFFLFLLVFVTDPFERLNFFPSEGMGLNPLLQNPGMIFHPPLLYVGYVGFTIPFAFALAALQSGHLGDQWIRAVRRWTIFSWYFLGIGILMGAQWAYVELGWGGYWAWDPVENASLMPWLTGTAFLHSVMIQERRDMMKVWNMVLIIITFCLTVFGTFITRSGVLSSVHSFAQSSLGYFFLAFMAGIIIYSLTLLINRLPLLRGGGQMDSMLSRESSFLFNNLILVGAAFSILWGTTFPILAKAVKGVEITVGPPFFNRINVPIGLSLLILTGICPLIAWRRATLNNLQRNFLIPAVVSLIGAGALITGGMRHSLAIASLTFCIFVTYTIITEFYKGAAARVEMAGEGPLKAPFNLVLRNPRRYGGYIIHLGIIAIFVGITGSSAFKVEQQVTLQKGQAAHIKNYTLSYDDFKTESSPNKTVHAAVISVYNEDKLIDVLQPEKNIYATRQDQPTSEVAIRSTLKEDLYIILGDFAEGGNMATFRFIVNPLVIWMWIGGFIITVGTLLVLLPDRRKGRREEADEEKRMRKVAVVSVLTLILAGLSTPAWAAALTRDEVSSELVCQCGCNLVLSSCNHYQCGSATPMRAKIDEMISEGYSKDQIIREFVDRYGEKVLAAPTKRGFNLTAWIIPFVGIGVGSLLIRKVLSGWFPGRPATEEEGTPRDPGAPGSPMVDRVEEELDEFEF